MGQPARIFYPLKTRKIFGFLFDAVLKSFCPLDTRMGKDPRDHVAHIESPDRTTLMTEELRHFLNVRYPDCEAATFPTTILMTAQGRVACSTL